MHLADFIPALAAVTCWEFSAAYFLIWLSISRRRVNLWFAILAFFLGAMNYFDLMLLDTRSRHTDLLWYYFHYFAVYGVAEAWIFFLPLMIRCPLPHPFTSRRVAAILICVSFCQFSPYVLHVAPASAPTDDFNAYVGGPLYGVYVMMAIGSGFISFVWSYVVILRRRMKLLQSPPDEGVLWARDRDLLLILWAAGAVVVSGTLELIQQLWWPRDHFYYNPRSLGSIVFCLLTASTLMRAILQNRNRQKVVQAERSQFDLLASARLQATYDLQHQIKNNLVAVELPLRNFLRSSESDTIPVVQSGRIIGALDEIQQLHRNLDVMLNASRLAAGEPIHLGQKTIVNVVALVDEICRRRTQWEQERRSGRFAVDGPQWEFLWSAQLSTPWVVLSADDLSHVLVVLLDNAVKYSPHGGTITLHLWSEGPRLRLSVADQGVGIKPEELALIGTRAFYRGDATQQSISGTGLGLYLARRLVEAQDGKFWVDSQLGSGSIFHVALPLENAPAIQQ